MTSRRHERGASVLGLLLVLIILGIMVAVAVSGGSG
jgi:Tfp pilus assembly protein FimT